jgi:hypothetical protein
LLQANLSGANLWLANFLGARIGNTIFERANFSETVGLDGTIHAGPSIVDRNTLQLSEGKLPESFLRGCGFPDWEIQSSKLYSPNLTNEEINTILYKVYDLRATQAIQISPLFISYSHVDTDFVDRLEIQLNKRGIRFWRDIHNAKAGRLETQVDIAIRQNQTVLLVLSANSLQSDWVEHEVRTARELEKQIERDVLCPIALDDSWKSSRWPKHVMEQVKEYNILDFSAWKDASEFGNTFKKLIGGLELFYKK